MIHPQTSYKWPLRLSIDTYVVCSTDLGFEQLSPRPSLIQSKFACNHTIFPQCLTPLPHGSKLKRSLWSYRFFDSLYHLQLLFKSRFLFWSISEKVILVPISFFGYFTWTIPVIPSILILAYLRWFLISISYIVTTHPPHIFPI